ncbi:MAG: bifunctional DNA-formamidopyrimidine glycosylase/DNA-(apurinic or apyrimidinic site) lyase [Candidatus Hodarchaeales archaeon]
MPEGPEVECVRRNLLSLSGSRVSKVTLTELSQKYPKYHDKQSLCDVFIDTSLKDIERRGKFLIWKFSVTPVILNHLGMSGKWLIDPEDDNYTHPKVLIEFKDGRKAIFDDVRNFGQFNYFPSYEKALNYRSIKILGVDGLEIPFNIGTFLELLNKERYSQKEIGQVLLDQRLVAGVGNIYKAESLFLAKINPKTTVSKLSNKKKRALGESISKTLHKALKNNGSTFGNQPYLLPTGKAGDAQKWHAVYAREGEPCQVCNVPIKRLKQKDRSTFYCPNCQK